MSKKLQYSVLASTLVIALVQREDGKDPETLSEITYDVSEIPAEIMDGEVARSLASYGLSSVLQDRTSGEKDPEARLEKIAEVFEQLKEGVWRSRRAAGDRKASIAADLAEAFRRYFESLGKEVTIAEVVEKLQAMDKDERKAASNHPDIKAHRAAVQAEAAKEAQEAGEGDDLDLATLF